MWPVLPGLCTGWLVTTCGEIVEVQRVILSSGAEEVVVLTVGE